MYATSGGGGVYFWGGERAKRGFLAISERQHRRWTRFLARTLRDGVSTGAFAALDPEATAPQVAALIDGFAVQATLGNPAISPARMRELCLDALRRLIAPTTC